MAQEFVGKRVAITLKKGRLLEGIVAKVQADGIIPQLWLSHAVFLDSGHKFPTFQVNGSDISDLKFIDETQKQPEALSRPQTDPPIASEPPVDPAIVSFGKSRPISQIYTGPNIPAISQLHSSPVKKVQLDGVISVDDAARLKGPFSALDHATNYQDDSTSKPVNTRKNSRKQKKSISQSQPPFQILQRDQSISEILPITSSIAKAESTTITTAQTLGRKGSRRSKKNLSRDDGIQDLKTTPTAFRGKGWRQSPMLKEATLANDIDNSPQKSIKKKSKKFRPRGDDLTGWATEDATDIQELGDFDFAGSLAKFDKRSVFEQLRKEDLVPEEERLVSHNKLKSIAHRPGTFGGTKLHPTENVLDIKSSLKPVSRRGSARPKISPRTSDSETELRNNSRLSVAKTRPKKLPGRTSASSLHKVERTNTDPPLVGRVNSNHSLHAASSTSNSHLPRLTPSETDEHPVHSGVQFYNDKTSVKCPVITPGGMTALEDLAVSQHKLKLHTMNENAGRSFAEIVIKALPSDLSKPRAIYFLGNHRSGGRALAAARHLSYRGITPVCCILGLDRPGSVLNAEVAKQMSMIEHLPDVVVANWWEVQKYLEASEKTGDFADVWIDALLAPGHSYDTLVPEDQSAVKEMVAWANSKPAGRQRLVFSIDVPCGINASNGEIITTEVNTKLQIRSTYIICMGAPRTGLLTALRNAWALFSSDRQQTALLGVTVFVVDIGINPAWRTFGKQLGLAVGNGVDFGWKWYLTLALDQNDGNEEQADDEEKWITE